MKRVIAALSLPAALGATVLGAYALTPLREYASPRDMPGAQQFATVGGSTLHYTDEGPHTGEPIVFIHGFGSWGFTWRNERVALAAAGFRVITIDMLGSGGSDRVLAAIYTTQTQADLLLGVLDQLGIDRARFVGHSYGGRVAMQIALFAPERVQALALLDPEAFNQTRPPIAEWLKPPGLGYALAFYSTAPQLVRTGLKMVSKRHEWLTDAVINGYAAPLYVAGSAAAQVWQGRSPKDGAQPVPTNLAAIRQPTLLIWGAQDPVFPPNEGQKLVQIMPNATLELITGAGHLPHEEAGERVRELLIGWARGA